MGPRGTDPPPGLSVLPHAQRSRVVAIFPRAVSLERFFGFSQIGSGAYPTAPAGGGGCVEIVASGLLIGTQIPEMGPLSHEMAVIQGQNLERWASHQPTGGQTCRH